MKKIIELNYGMSDISLEEQIDQILFELGIKKTCIVGMDGYLIIELVQNK